jgi:hypothetical protein
MAMLSRMPRFAWISVPEVLAGPVYSASATLPLAKRRAIKTRTEEREPSWGYFFSPFPFFYCRHFVDDLAAIAGERR